MTKATIREGFNYTCRDGTTVKPMLCAAGTYRDAITHRHFTAEGGCIAYYRGTTPEIDEKRSIIPTELERIFNIETGPDFGSELQGGSEPPITNAERLSSGEIKPR